MSLFDRLRVYLEARAVFTESELETIKAVFVPMALRPGEFLQRAGEPARRVHRRHVRGDEPDGGNAFSVLH